MSKSHVPILAFILLFSSAQGALCETVGNGLKDLPEITRVRAILQQPEDQIDLGKIKLTIDKMIDPSTDVELGMKQLDAIVSKIRVLAGPYPSDRALLTALRKYLYEKGPWNDYKPYHYDFSDPLGENLRNKRLLTYLSTRSGNCISMPLLFIVLGQRLGIEVTASTAPEHVFVKYTDRESGRVFNLEATSGANTTRDEWYRQQFPMTDQAIANGLYLRVLSKRETAAVMAELLMEQFGHDQRHEKVIAISDVLLECNPKNVYAILKKGHAYYCLLKENFLVKYPAPNQIPVAERGYFEHLADNNLFWFDKAESLGWREPTPKDERAYLDRVKRTANASAQ